MSELNSTSLLSQRAKAIEVYSLVHGGGTFGPDGQPLTSGIAVAFKVLGTSRDLELGWLAQTLAVVADGYLGTWFDHENDGWELSEVAVIRSRSSALSLAAVLGERYVFDLATNECIAVVPGQLS